MLTIILRKDIFIDIINGKVDEIHKEIKPFYTNRFKTRFGIIDGTVEEDIVIMCSKNCWKDDYKRIIKCTVKPDSGPSVHKYSKYYGFEYDRIERYVIKILDIRPFDIPDDEINEKEMPIAEAIAYFKKELVTQLKEEKQDTKRIRALKVALEYMNHNNRANTDQVARRSGHRKALREVAALNFRPEKIEVVNTEGYAPYCQVCRSSTAIYARDGSRNVFCGKCGTLLDWSAVEEKYDNYDKIKEAADKKIKPSTIYYERRIAIEEILRDRKSETFKEFSDMDKPEEAKKHNN